MEIILPNGWRPRDYQRRLWHYLENGGKRAVAVWHRRAGKDEVCLHWAACAALQRVGNYWHMLPEASQARKAVWDAINPHTGRRRIAEAFPSSIRVGQRDEDMKINLANGSTWQLVGSDRFDALVGSPPIGLVFSEYSLTNPGAWDYLRPILAENGGWAVFMLTPRGRNHAWTLYDKARLQPGWFAELLTVDDTKAIGADVIAAERASGMPDAALCDSSVGAVNRHPDINVREFIDRLCGGDGGGISPERLSEVLRTLDQLNEGT
jgi:phage terminase large subunit